MMVCWGIPGHTLLALTPDGDATALSKWLPNRDTVAYLNGVYLTEERIGPVNILAWWAKDTEGKPIACGDDKPAGELADLPAWQSAHVDRDGLS
ncbi:hypothetical protein [Kouleothrix sp.]|uniref:hypothetical protein n=1 Tax=Kouleothrix sp. TaxID=2779161 RepID=UPI00391DD488